MEIVYPRKPGKRLHCLLAFLFLILRLPMANSFWTTRLTDCGVMAILLVISICVVFYTFGEKSDRRCIKSQGNVNRIRRGDERVS